MLEKGLSLHSRPYFAEMFAKMRDLTVLLTAKRNGEYMGGMIMQMANNAAIYAFNGIRSFEPVSPNQLLVWE